MLSTFDIGVNAYQKLLDLYRISFRNSILLIKIDL